MSEDFLTRWSRRKRKADERSDERLDEPTPDAPASPPPRQPGAKAAPPNEDTEPRQQAAAVPAADLTRLPPLESITASTDIRDFLAAGVPEALKRAALSRAWTADPAIRDFVGLAENQWDFTAPDGIPGFGPMLPTDDVARMAARIVGKTELPELRPAEADESPKLESSAHESSIGGDNEPPPATTKSDTQEDSNPTVSSVVAERNSASDDKIVDIAMQNDPTPDPDPVRRGHGGALPQ